MDIRPTQSEEKRRLDELRSFEILDSPPEISFDQFTYMASSLCQTPISLLSFFDDQRQWSKSTYGFEVQQLPKHFSACNQTIKSSDYFVIDDSLKTKCDFDSFMKAQGFRFYAGVPIISRSGLKIGALCVIDYRSRKISN